MGQIKDFLQVPCGKLKPYKRNARIHSDEQIAKIMDSIREFGFLMPMLVDRKYQVIAGHGRLEAAKRLEMETVPCVFVEGLTEAQRKAYILADNRLTELASWDMNIVREEIEILDGLDFDTSVIGFDLDLDNLTGSAGSDGDAGRPGGKGDHALMIDSTMVPMTNIEYQDLMYELDQYIKNYETNEGFVTRLLQR